jgi:hypothetical protein
MHRGCLSDRELPAAAVQRKPADASELPRIMLHNFESAPQGTSREQQLIGSNRRTGLARNCTATRASSRSARPRSCSETSARLPARAARGPDCAQASPYSTSISVVTETANCRGASLMKPNRHGPVAPREVAQHIGVEEIFHETASLRGASNSPQFDSKDACPEYLVTREATTAGPDRRAFSCPAIRAAACGSTAARLAQLFGRSVQVLGGLIVELEVEVHDLLQVIPRALLAQRRKS